MINIVSNLDRTSIQNENTFLYELLESAINIVPEADYGKIWLVDNDDKYKIIDTIGHNYDLLTELRIDKEISSVFNMKGINFCKGHSFSTNNLSDKVLRIFKKALKPVQRSIYINIVVDEEITGRIVLDIAAGKDKQFSETTKQLLNSFANLASAFFSFQRYNKLQGRFTKELVTSTIKILELHDNYTRGHSENVAQVASKIAEKMGLSKKEIKDAYWAGMVHDIGKLLVPLGILNKAKALTSEEFNVIKKHPHWGYIALDKTETLSHIARYVLYHHEKWDGTGYPKGLKSKEIPLLSQILAVADAWDAMTSHRAYRKALSTATALQEIKNNRGTQFSPRIVDAFLSLQRVRKSY